MRRSSPNLTAPTSDRAVQFALRFAAANDDVIAFVRGLTGDEWRAPCERGGRSIGQVVEHIAAGHLIIAGIVEAMALGLPLPVASRRTEATGARFNARQAARFADHSPSDGLRSLRRNGGIVARFLASLTDEQLDRATDTIEGPLTTQDEIEHGLLGHLRRHFEEVRAAVRA
ncbi:MAG: DinB family protein [Candidatus Limnocylindrales bacterium]